ncbi:MAG: dTDP-glucose 4,6-dehydratase [Chloroflexi bacterium]|nr:MAG: dTDP-glucose 4,6-dehydratase [Chloroflexota bacterium]
MKNILVTGGAGFIGSNFVQYILDKEQDVRVVNLDLLTYAGSLENLKGLTCPERHIFVEGDICDRELVSGLFQRYEIDTVVHFAAESHVDRSIADPGPFIRTNIHGTYALLEEARRYWLIEKKVGLEDVRFHHVSTDEVYGMLQPGDPAFKETTPYAPNSPYAASKASSDHLVRSYHHTYGLPVSITNCSNNYGPHQFPEKLIPLMILNAIEGKTLPVYGDGQQIRDWLYVVDHCEAIHSVLVKGKVGETYNVGGNNQPPNLTIVKTICDLLDECLPQSPYIPHESLIKFVPDRPGHDRRYAMDIRKISKELGWEPRQSLTTGLLKTVEWYLSNKAWIEKIRVQKDYQQWLDKNYAKRGD